MAMLRSWHLAALLVGLSATVAAGAGSALLKERRDLAASARAVVALERAVVALDMLYQTVEARVPGMLVEMPAPGPDDRDALACDPSHLPLTHAVLIGSDTPFGDEARVRAIVELTMGGPENDVQLIANALTTLGVASGRVHVHRDSDANRSQIAASLSTVAAQIGCGDRAVLYVAGMGEDYHPGYMPFRSPVWPRDPAAEAALDEGWARLGATDPGPIPTDLSTRQRSRAEQDRLDIWRQEYANANRLGLDIVGDLPPEDPRRSLLRRWPQWDHGNLDSKLYLHRPAGHGMTEVLLGSEIAGTLALWRARGAHVIAILDHDRAASGDLFARSGGLPEAVFSYHRRDAAEEDAARLPEGAGGITVIEAAVTGNSFEMPLPSGAEDAVIHGLFTFHLAHALLDYPLADPRHLAEAVTARMQEGDASPRADFRITATDPHLILIPEAAPEARDAEAIRIIAPDLTRGASRIEQPRIDLVAAIDWPARILGVWADDEPVEVAPDGTFTRNLRLQTGLNRVVLTALTGDSRLHRRVVEFAFDGDREALAGQGQRYALLIANQTYGGNTGFSHLQTPIGDARAVGAILRERFGFVTEARRDDGTPIPLLLEDPSQRAILRALNSLAMVARPEDTVLIFYAGHGVSDQTLGMAAWAPADTERGFPDSLLHSATLENALRRFRAGNLIVISDSCYAGGLFRSDDAAPAGPEDAARIDWLLRAQARTSRVLVTSGSDQPVLDGGGDGHSVFARALLTGLAEMPDEAFTAAELFQRFLLHPVAGRTAQEPQYRTLRELGHVGGDVVFVAAAP